MQLYNDRIISAIHTFPTDGGTPVQCEIFAPNARSISREQIITALWEAVEACSLEEIHREQIVLNLHEPQQTLTFTNRLYQNDGKPLNARMHIYMQQSARGQTIQGFIEPAVAEPTSAPMLITYLAPFAATLHPISINAQIETLLGFSLADWRTTPDLWYQQLHPADRERVLLERQHSYNTEQPFCSEYRMRSRDGRVIWLREEATPLTNGYEHPQYMQGLLLDITQRKQYEEQYAQAAKTLFNDEVSEPIAESDFAPLLTQAVGQ
jgi:PAS domain S-box-containing protein